MRGAAMWGSSYAATEPDRCRTLVTLGTPIQTYTRAEQVRFRFLLAVYRVVGMVDFLASGIVDVLLSPRTRAHDSEAVALVLDGLRTMKRRALANAMVSISLRRPDLTSRLAAIRCPTLFVTGSDHSGWTPEQAERTSHLLVTGSVIVIPDTAYLTPLEAPEETVRVVRDLWRAARPSQLGTEATEQASA